MASMSPSSLLERLADKCNNSSSGGNSSNIPKSKRKLQKHLRSAGLEYISRTGKIIPAKRVADELCQCPQKCDERVPIEARHRLFVHFYGLGEADLQNQFLRQNMDLRARLNVPETSSNTSTSTTTSAAGRSPRRITCKYLVPLLPDEDDTVEVCQKAFVSAFVITTKRVRLQREKLIASLGLNSYSSHNRGKALAAGAVGSALQNNNNNIQTANNNIAAMVESMRKEAISSSTNNESSHQPKSPELPSSKSHHPVVAASSKKSSKRAALDNPLIPLGLLVPDGVTIAPVYNADHDRDIAIVHNFFSNQLWKPEYIGAYS